MSQSVVRWVVAVKACHVVEGEFRRERNVELRTGSIGSERKGSDCKVA